MRPSLGGWKPVCMPHKVSHGSAAGNEEPCITAPRVDVRSPMFEVARHVPLSHRFLPLSRRQFLHVTPRHVELQHGIRPILANHVSLYGKHIWPPLSESLWTFMDRA